MDRRKRVKSNISGFTLIEITLAFVILAGSLVVILGLQASILDRTLQDKNKQYAMLIARRILGAIETSTDELETRDDTEDASKLLVEFLGDGGVAKEDEEELQRYTAHIKIEEIGLPEINDKAMKKISLGISWGTSPNEMFFVNYFVPHDPEEQI